MPVTDSFTTFAMRAGGSPSLTTRDDVVASLAVLGLILKPCKWKGSQVTSTENIKKAGGGAWSGGGIQVNRIDGEFWLSTFPLMSKYITPGRSAFDVESIERYDKQLKLTRKWQDDIIPLREGYQIPCRSINISTMTNQDITNLVGSFQ